MKKSTVTMRETSFGKTTGEVVKYPERLHSHFASNIFDPSGEKENGFVVLYAGRRQDRSLLIRKLLLLFIYGAGGIVSQYCAFLQYMQATGLIDTANKMLGCDFCNLQY